MCSLSLAEDHIVLDLWRDGQKPKRCRVPEKEYEDALDEAFGARVGAYAA
jgi:hypothetical protein